jgi:hypothetical protein
MPIDEKRERLRQVIQGAIPTKVTKLRDGDVEAVFGTLGVLVADAKIAREFDGSQTLLPHIVSTLMRQYNLDRVDGVTSTDSDQSRQTLEVTLQLDGERAPIDSGFRYEKMGEGRVSRRPLMSSPLVFSLRQFDASIQCPLQTSKKHWIADRVIVQNEMPPHPPTEQPSEQR